MHLCLSCGLMVFVFTVPPAVKVLAIAAFVYAIMQAAKKSPWLSPYLKGWVAVAVNVVLTIAGIVMAIPANQLYTMDTLQLILITVLTSAGVHGTVSKLVNPSPGQ